MPTIRDLSQSCPVLPLEGADPDGRPLACLHGFIESPALWRALPAGLWRGHAAVALPLPGHAPWHLPPAAIADLFEGDRLVDCYADLLRQRFAGRPVRFVGHSSGALVILSLALRHPDLVSDALLIAPLFSGLIKSRSLPGRLLQIPVAGPAAFDWMLGRWLADDAAFLRGLGDVCAPGAALPDLSRPAGALHRMRLDLRASDPAALYACGAWVGGQDLRARLDDLARPVEAVICLGDPVVEAAHQMELASAAPMVQAALLRCGHLPFVECAGALRRLCDAWLAQDLLAARAGAPAPEAV